MAEERRDGRSEGAAPELADAAPPDALAEHREAPRALDAQCVAISTKLGHVAQLLVRGRQLGQESCRRCLVDAIITQRPITAIIICVMHVDEFRLSWLPLRVVGSACLHLCI